ncbi:MAG: hypothetical protein ACODAG_02985, partial [Myxococcota bacterium]
MATIDTIADVQVTRATRTPSRVGFGLPLIAGWTDAFPEVVRSFTDPADLLDLDGIESEDLLYKEAVSVMSQNPRPRRFLVGRRTQSSAPTQSVSIGEFTTTVGATVGLTIRGERAEYEVQEGDDAAAVLAGFASAVNALSVSYTATEDEPNDVVDIAADDAGLFSAFENPQGCVIVADDTPSESFADDLSAIRESNDDWYCLLHPQSSNKAQILDIAEAIEATTKLYVTSASDFDMLDTEDDQDVHSQLEEQGYDRSSAWYHHELGGGLAGGIAGRQLPKDAGRSTWAHKDVAGVPVTPQHVGGR